MKDLKPEPKTGPAPAPELAPAKVAVQGTLAFFRQFAALFQAGVPILKALQVLKPQPEYPALENVVDQILVRVESGSSLSSSLQQYPGVFSKVAVTLVQVGEESGRLGDSLRQVAETLERDDRMLRRVKGALTYPAIVLCATLGLTFALMFWVMPAFTGIFASLKADLPLLTRIVWGATEALRNPIAWIVAIVVVEGVHFRLRALRLDPKGAVRLCQMLLATPLVGPIFYHCCLARYCNSAEALLESGNGLVKALQLSAQSSGSAVLENDMHSLTRAVREGEMTSAYMRSRPTIYSNTLTQMLAAGEEAASLASMFAHAGAYHELEMESRVALLAVSLEPLMLVLVSIVIGAIMIATFLPLYGALAKL